MSDTKDIQNTEQNRAIKGLSRFSATALATKFGDISRAVFQHGATVITKHNEPTMVLMSIERYIQLEHAAGQRLDSLTREFDQLYARMQTPGVAERTVQALDLDD